jgi:hypothetical protein
MLLSVGQAFGAVSVTGAVLQSVGKNINAAYSATAGYNGQPALQAEEMVTGESWTHTASAAAGTYAITITFELTFTILLSFRNCSFLRFAQLLFFA